MVSNWTESKLEDCMDAIIDYRGKTPKKTTSGIPLVTAKIIKAGRVLPVSEFISEDDYDAWMTRGIPNPGDIVLTTEAPLGEVAQLDDRKIALAQRVITLRGKEGVLDNTFLKYLLLSHYVQHQLDGRGTGTTVKGIKQSELRKVILKFPPFPEQKAIALILGSLDDKIELNRQMNETLEAMAQAFFKSWFVDFDPVIDNALTAGNAIPDVFAERASQRKALNKDEAISPLFPDAFEYTEEMGWIPKGWKSVKLDTLLEVKYGKDHKKLDDGNIPVYGSGGLMRLVNKSLYSGESILIPRKGTLCNIMFVDEEFWSVDTMFFTIPKLPHSAKYLFQQLKMLDFSSMNVGSAVPSMTTKVLNDLNILKPSHNALEESQRLATDFFNKEKELNRQSTALSKLRSTLLPKLLSGEIRIPDAEKLVEEAQTS